MNKERINELKAYLKANIAPILVSDVDINFIKKDAVILPANIKKSSLNGTLNEGKLLPPNWYNELVKKCNKESTILIITDLSKISKEEQEKFYEILKYRKIGTLELPKNCIILVNGKLEELNETIKSLVITM